jgi:hypothetical protein
MEKLHTSTERGRTVEHHTEMAAMHIGGKLEQLRQSSRYADLKRRVHDH